MVEVNRVELSCSSTLTALIMSTSKIRRLSKWAKRPTRAKYNWESSSNPSRNYRIRRSFRRNMSSSHKLSGFTRTSQNLMIMSKRNFVRVQMKERAPLPRTTWGPRTALWNLIEPNLKNMTTLISPKMMKWMIHSLSMAKDLLWDQLVTPNSI